MKLRELPESVYVYAVEFRRESWSAGKSLIMHHRGNAALLSCGLHHSKCSVPYEYTRDDLTAEDWVVV